MIRTTAFVALLSSLILAAGCGSTEGVSRPEYPKELQAELTSLDEPLSLQDDYWTQHLGAYLAPEDLHSYWIQPEDKRFVTYGERWLEFCLREDLLRERAWRLSDEVAERFRSQPDFDSSKRILDSVPDSESQ